jgi:hypothetical protein
MHVLIKIPPKPSTPPSFRAKIRLSPLTMPAISGDSFTNSGQNHRKTKYGTSTIRYKPDPRSDKKANSDQ